MKDARGHGSNSRGGGDTQEPLDLGRAATHVADPNVNGGKFMPNPNYDPSYAASRSTDSQAASTLSQGAPPSKAGPAPVHPAMGGERNFAKMSPAEKQASRARDSASNRNEYNRDLALRARNGQVGSGMKFRG